MFLLGAVLVGCDATVPTDQGTARLERQVDRQADLLDSQAEEIRRLEDRIAFLEADVSDLEESVVERLPAPEPEREIPARWDCWSVMTCDAFVEAMETRDRSGDRADILDDFFGVFYAGSRAEVAGLSAATEEIRDGLQVDDPEMFGSGLAELGRICSPVLGP